MSSDIGGRPTVRVDFGIESPVCRWYEPERCLDKGGEGDWLYGSGKWQEVWRSRRQTKEGDCDSSNSGDMSLRSERNRNAFWDGVFRPEDPEDEPKLDGDVEVDGKSRPRVDEIRSTRRVSAARASHPSKRLLSMGARLEKRWPRRRREGTRKNAWVQDRIVCDTQFLWLDSVIKTGRIPKAEASRGHAILANDDDTVAGKNNLGHTLRQARRTRCKSGVLLIS